MSFYYDGAERAIKIHGNSLMRVAFTYTKNMDDAEDVVQEVFLKYITNAPKFKSDEHEKAWLIRVTINMCKNYLASSYRKTYAELDESVTVSDSYSTGLADAVNALPHKYRIVIHLYYYEGYSQKEIGKIISLTESAVASRLQRGRDLLKKKIGDDFFD